MTETLIYAATTLIGALGGFLLAFAQAAKTRAEAKRTRIEIQNLQKSFTHEMKPNSGSSLKDQLNRIEATQRGMSKDIGRLADQDLTMQQAKDRSHNQIHGRIDELGKEIQTVKRKIYGHE